MAMWRIRRIDAPLVQGVILECDAGDNQGVVTLEEITSGTTATISACIPSDPARTSELLGILKDAGFAPNDWTP